MSEKYNTNVNSIEEAIKQLEDLKKDRLSFVTGDAEHDNIFLRDVQAIEIVLGNLEALADMQKTADRELENARRINEEHKRENGELRNKVKELERVIDRGWLVYTEKLENQIADLKYFNRQKIREIEQNSIPKEVIEDKIDELKSQGNYRTFNNPNGRIHFLKEETDYKIEALKELLQESEE